MVENLTSRKAQVCDSRVPAKFNHSPDGKVHEYIIIIKPFPNGVLFILQFFKLIKAWCSCNHCIVLENIQTPLMEGLWFETPTPLEIPI